MFSQPTSQFPYQYGSPPPACLVNIYAGEEFLLPQAFLEPSS
ncbi:hypothetical protein KKC1_08390 [Calderihabitans maritimus]|uniref:Uncharacterized protein n=1 Tax=Calderihabitans maritimus TaxID=1246530 RepID=A0A1Z5HQG1_9FIRM|nr:hypothetical protein KKC1_08390 [Calderihabitans maritimus]